MTDETPKRPDEKDDTMPEDDHDPHVPEVTRREAMSTPAKAALGGAGVLGILGLSTGSASAQQSLEPAQVLRDSQDREIRLRMLGGDLLLEHIPSGNTWTINGSGLTGDTLNASGIVDTTDGGPWETLRGAGYEKGEKLVVGSFGPNAVRQESTTSASYSSKFDQSQVFITWQDMFPNSGSTYTQLQYQVFPGSGETGSFRLYNRTDEEVMAGPVDAGSSGLYTTGWDGYTPTTTTSPIEIVAQVKTDPGSNTTQFNTPTLLFSLEV